VLDTLGDKWTLLIIRDLILGKKRYQELMSSPEAIASNIRANRLKKLESAGLITREAYQLKPARYQYFLTEKGGGAETGIECDNHVGPDPLPWDLSIPPHRPSSILVDIWILSHLSLRHWNQLRDTVQLDKTF
jgi:DNA-binding HxlR family transcriptional regulator